MCKNEIEIDGVTYVKKSEVPELTKDYVIIRTHSAGVHAGYLVSQNGQEVELKDSRRIWYWDGAASLSQLAMEGVTKPENCKFAMVLPKIILTQTIEIIPCSKKAQKIISEVAVWKI
jgi:hypothetical protein